jgi:hypothetical protein
VLNQILKRQTSHFLYGSKVPAVTITVLITILEQNRYYSDFLKRHLHLRNRLLDQGYEKIRLIRSLKKFIFRYQDLVELYSVSAETIINNAFSYSENVKISQQPENCENRNDPDLVQAFLKKWWVESDFKAPNLPLVR